MKLPILKKDYNKKRKHFSLQDFAIKYESCCKQKQDFFIVSYTKEIEACLKILKNEGFIQKYLVIKYKNQPIFLGIKPNYVRGSSNIKVPFLKRIKVAASNLDYIGYKDINKYLYKFNSIKGLMILSTSKGILSNAMALNLKIGGQILLYIE